MCKPWQSSFKLSLHLNYWPNDSAKASPSCLLQQNRESRTQEHTDPPEKAEVTACNNQVDQGHNSNGDDKEDQQDPPADNADQNQSEAPMKTTHSDEVHKTDALIVRDWSFFILYWYHKQIYMDPKSDEHSDSL